VCVKAYQIEVVMFSFRNIRGVRKKRKTAIELEAEITGASTADVGLGGSDARIARTEASTTAPHGLLLPKKGLPMNPIIWSRTDPASLGLGAERYDARTYPSPARWQRTLCVVSKLTSALRRPIFSVRLFILAPKGRVVSQIAYYLSL
jgi:hypothetical protein